MDTPKPESTASQVPASARAALAALVELRDELQKMHAELEYLRLMLRLNARD
ncbi:hypothetical protein [Rubrivivax gelatinosus]|uniref:Uncharacterized protein n=1 Tax=Rubrivivax gelatinosus (strain NBRC 100245 / IL144) TaxID=983917 RepID=I0HRJ7_RUBGI|nr:hypothetical protein [Rubrivivax gelatinosus]MBG6082166.1 hypothetical protein [Rubrivivax gelatinosus]BAL95634.1 hypothetical protein RGE_22930 [Rubrivivax gelatinosus IL144]